MFEAGDRAGSSAAASGAPTDAMRDASSELSRRPAAPADTIVVRTPVEADREPVRALCKAMHARTIFGDIPFSDAKFDRAIVSLKDRPRQSVGLVAELNGRVIGAAWASVGEYFIGEGVVLTTGHVIAVDVPFCGRLLAARTFLRLVAAVRKWSATRGAKRLLVHVTTGRDLASTDRLLRAAGLEVIGGGYAG